MIHQVSGTRDCGSDSCRDDDVLGFFDLRLSFPLTVMVPLARRPCTPPVLWNFLTRFETFPMLTHKRAFVDSCSCCWRYHGRSSWKNGEPLQFWVWLVLFAWRAYCTQTPFLWFCRACFFTSHCRAMRHSTVVLYCDARCFCSSQKTTSPWFFKGEVVQEE